MPTKKLAHVIAAILLLAFPSLASAKTVSLAASQIPVMVESAEKGLFIDLVREVARRTGLVLDIQVVPAKRGVEMVRSGQILGGFPFIEPVLDFEVARASSGLVKTDFAFVKKGAPIPKSLDDLVGKKVGITSTYDYSSSILKHPGIMFEPGPSDESNLKKLQAGRIDAFIVEIVSGLGAAQAAGVEVDYAKDSPVDRQDVFFGFQNTPEGREIAEKFDAALKEIKADGTFQKIFGFPPS